MGKRRATEESPATQKHRFRHSSNHDDLKSLIDEHMLGPAAAAATADWYPSRRGNSPRSAASKST
jgi:hypothetical protein